MTPQERANLDFVLEWWSTVIDAGQLDKVADYQAADYIQHHPMVPTGRDAFVDFFTNVVRVERKDTVADGPNPAPVVTGAKGDFVFMIFEQESEHPADPSKTYHHNSFEIIRFENGKIQEHWDSAKRIALPPGAPPLSFEQPASMHAKGSTGTLSDEERRNIEIATIELKDMLQYGHLELADEVMDPGYIQHNPNVPQGRDGFKAFMSQRPGRTPEPIRAEWKNPPALTLASGPYVVMMWERTSPDPNDASREYVWNHYDVLRIEDGLVKEHWDEAVIAPPSN